MSPCFLQFFISLGLTLTINVIFLNKIIQNRKKLKFTQVCNFWRALRKISIFENFSLRFLGFWGSFSYKNFSYKKTCRLLATREYQNCIYSCSAFSIGIETTYAKHLSTKCVNIWLIIPSAYISQYFFGYRVAISQNPYKASIWAYAWNPNCSFRVYARPRTSPIFVVQFVFDSAWKL